MDNKPFYSMHKPNQVIVTDTKPCKGIDGNPRRSIPIRHIAALYNGKRYKNFGNYIH